MHQNHNQTSVMQSLSILDKCTQIIRQDRIWLRNLIKANNQDALLLFRGLPKIPNMKDLQIKIRKYINRAKQRQKQQQLQRFKQNMQLPQFIDQACQKKVQPYQHNHNKSQSKLRSPLVQNEPNAAKSSFVAKWNNYTHYNHQNNFMQNKSQFSQISSVSQHDKNLKKQWSNNYRPHSFNKNLNGQLANKLSHKNKSTSNLKKSNTQGLHYSKQKSFRNNEEQYNLNSTHVFGQSGRNSSKSLRQLQNKIYEQLRIFQNNKHRKQPQIFNKTHSQNLTDHFYQKQSPSISFPQTQKSTSFSRQNIDQILKSKLGNCDYQSYKKQKSFCNEEQNERQIIKQKNSSQKKLYNEGLFPPIQQQTQRDSQSQRYPEQPLRFGTMSSKQQMEDRHKFTFSSFAKASPQLNKSFKNNQILQINNISNQKYTSNQKQKGAQLSQMHQFPFEQNTNTRLFQSRSSNNYHQRSFEDPKSNHKISNSIYQSAQKKNDYQQNYLKSDLHNSIMNSIKKSREEFPSESYHYNSNASQKSEHNQFESLKFNQINSFPIKQSYFDLPKPTLQVQNYSLKSSTYADEGSLFTSPELLNECRNFLKKTQQINFQNSGLKDFNNKNSSLQYSKFESPTNSHQRSFKQALNGASNMLNFPQPITITQSITKDFYQQNNSQSKINSLFESKQTSQNKNNNIDFQTYSKPLSIFNNENSFKKSQFLQSSTKKEPSLFNEVLNMSNKNHLSENKNSYMREHVSQEKMSNNKQQNGSFKKHPQIQAAMGSEFTGRSQPQGYNLSQQYMNSSNNSKGNSPTQMVPQPLQQNYIKLQDQNKNIQYQTSEFNDLNAYQNRITQNSNSKSIVSPIWNLIQYEQIIDTILAANQGNIQLSSTWLRHTLQNKFIFAQQIGASLEVILHDFLQEQATYCCVQIFEKIQEEYRKNPSYQQIKCPSRDISLLLDIDQKGYITFQDIKSFIQQLQTADVQNIDQIKRNLIQVFQSADFMQINRISYTNLYIIKSQDSFEKLCDDLQQFQFEIEGE